jgi:ribosomal protein S4
MPRVKKRGHLKRDAEIPISEWSLGELKAELDRLGEDSSDLNKWAAFKRESELRNELFKRTGRDE